MPRISAEQLEKRRESILDAGMQAFAETGFEGTSTAVIARRAGISEGLIYRYFPSKRTLLLLVLRRFGDSLLDEIEKRVLPHEGFARRLRALIEHYLRNMVAQPEFTRLYMAEVHGATEGGLNPGKLLTERSRLLWKRMIADAVASGEISPEADTKLTRELIWSSIECAAALHVDGALNSPIETSAARISDLLVHGMARPEG